MGNTSPFFNKYFLLTHGKQETEGRKNLGCRHSGVSRFLHSLHLPPPTRPPQIQSEGLFSFAEYSVACCGGSSLRSRNRCLDRIGKERKISPSPWRMRVGASNGFAGCQIAYGVELHLAVLSIDCLPLVLWNMG